MIYIIFICIFYTYLGVLVYDFLLEIIVFMVIFVIMTPQFPGGEQQFCDFASVRGIWWNDDSPCEDVFQSHQRSPVGGLVLCSF